MRYNRKFYGVIGDSDPIAHWGGAVFSTDGHDTLVYFQGWGNRDDDGEYESITVSVVPLDFDASDYETWFDSVDRSHGQDPGTTRKLMTSEDPMDRAFAAELIAGHYGWIELDCYPRELTPRQAQREYGRIIDACHRHAAKIRAKRQAAAK